MESYIVAHQGDLSESKMIFIDEDARQEKFVLVGKIRCENE